MQFLNIRETGFVKRWSTDRALTVTVLVEGQLVNEPNTNLKKFNNEPVFDLKDYTCTYQLFDPCLSKDEDNRVQRKIMETHQMQLLEVV